MNLTLAHIGGRAGASDFFEALVRMYVGRTAAYFPCEAAGFRSSAALREWIEKPKTRIAPTVVLLDSRGKALSSEELAGWIGTRRDQGTRHLVFAIGPADGWDEEARRRAHLLLSLGPMTLAHSLARVVVAEQVYRACTILAGHPYHTGH